MKLISYEFIFFMITLFVLYYIVPKKFRYLLILVFNLIFYYIIGRTNIIFIIITSFISYLCGLLLQGDRKGKKAALAITIIVNLIVLFILKFDYINTNMYELNLIPIGVSFYILQNISYVVDIYREKITPESNLLKYLTYEMYFPSLFIGPINRYKDIKEKLLNGNDFNILNVKTGLLMIMTGLIKKLVIAERLNIIINNIIANDYNGPIIFIMLILFIFRLYFDFSGGIDIVRGFSKMLGIDLLENFNRPLLSTSLKEFWRRWHISLSSFFKDYVYIPLGGSKHGKIRTFVNLLIVFTLSGLWHGINYIAWGLLNGIYLIIESFFKPKKTKPRMVLTFIVVCLLMSFYVYDNPMFALTKLSTLFNFSSINLLYNGTLLNLGLNISNMIIMISGVIIFMLIEVLEEFKNFDKNKYLKYINIMIFITFFIVIVFGIYGIEFNVSDFIYNKF